uniref:NSFL1 cofactor p47 n=1 Tax=Cacopsylla melanoneura TaxID=428564 RepID=A0A8D8V109_9HEMI
MSDQQNLITQFIEITGVEESRAKFYLESSGWDLNLATASFFEGDADEGGPRSVESLPQSDNDEQDTPPPAIHFHGPGSSKPKTKSKEKKPASKPKFGTIASLKDQDDDDDSDEEEGQKFYAGGSTHSGQQVIGPGKKKKDFVAEMFKSVQEQGPDILADPQTSSGRGGSSHQFGGTGYRLGQTDNDTQVIVAPGSSNNQERQIEITLKLWKEGFSINDGELRAYTDPANAEFLSSIKRGVVPTELLRDAKGGEIHMSMVDNRHETYVAPKPQVKPFCGQGHTLGSPVPTTIGQTKVFDEKDRLANENAAKESVQVNSSEPTTSIQIRLSDGSRLIGTFNHTHTLNDVRSYINTARPQYETSDYGLMTAFPSKELTDNSQTVKNAGILNAAIIQKLR